MATNNKTHWQKRIRKLSLRSFIGIASFFIIGCNSLVTEDDNESQKGPDKFDKQIEQQLKFEEEIDRQLKISGGKYTFIQALLRARNNTDRKFDYSARNDQGRLSSLFEDCMQADYTKDQVPNRVKKLWKDIQYLKNNKTIIAPALIRFSEDANIFHCLSSKEDNPTASGTWNEREGAANLNEVEYKKRDYRRLIQIHEILHGVQSSSDFEDRNIYWPMQEFQMYDLSYEAAAKVTEALVALEFYIKGDKRLWHELQDDDDDTITRIILRSYYQQSKIKGVSHKEALTHAGKMGFQAQLKNQSWLDFYNKDTLLLYIKVIAGDFAKRNSEKKYSLEIARMAGYISPEFNFTATLNRLPISRKGLFGNNKKMRQAFEYVELEHIAATHNRQHPEYLKKLTQLEVQKNPYLGVDLRLINKDLNHPENKISALDAMDCWAGIISCESNGERLAVSANKIKMRSS